MMPPADRAWYCSRPMMEQKVHLWMHPRDVEISIPPTM